MMMTKRSFVVLVLFVILPKSDQRATSELTETARQKRMAMIDDKNAFSNDINGCLFQYWTPFVGNNRNPVLEKLVDCNNGIGLCYGAPSANPKVKRVAQYAVCYNTNTRIPEFSGHIVKPGIAGQGRVEKFRADAGVELVATDANYKAPQRGLYGNYDELKHQFFARGHLTPNADFATDEEREYTMITTNIAPQWQLFNGGNWEKLERALRSYATTKQDLYVFTGTGGAAKNEKGVDIKLDGLVLAPQWYWKAVCDPKAKESALFFGENTIGKERGKRVAMTEPKTTGCYDKVQTNRLGVIHCLSLSDAKTTFKNFQIPVFHIKNCVPSEIGVGFKTYIHTALE